MDTSALIAEYAAGPALLRRSVAGLTREQLVARPVAGKWSTLEVVCHIADTETLYADRMKRVLAEHEPLLPGVDPDVFAASLFYAERDVEEELAVVEAVRRQMVRLLSKVDRGDFARVGRHSSDGPLTLETLLARITRHVPHHVGFIEEKRRALQTR